MYTTFFVIKFLVLAFLLPDNNFIQFSELKLKSVVVEYLLHMTIASNLPIGIGSRGTTPVSVSLAPEIMFCQISIKTKKYI